MREAKKKRKCVGRRRYPSDPGPRVERKGERGRKEKGGGAPEKKRVDYVARCLLLPKSPLRAPRTGREKRKTPREKEESFVYLVLRSTPVSRGKKGGEEEGGGTPKEGGSRPGRARRPRIPRLPDSRRSREGEEKKEEGRKKR